MVQKRVDVTERGPERRAGVERRSGLDRRFAERRDPERAGPGRRVVFPFDRRVAERRFLDRRSEWPQPATEFQEAQAY